MNVKRYLLVLAALSLSGCAYGNYKASYLEEYAGYDCGNLQWEMMNAQAELQQSQQNRDEPVGVSTPTIRDTGGVPRHVTSWSWSPLGHIGGVGSAPSPSQKWRMQNHARRQAIQQLENSQGCRNEEAAPIS